MKRTFCLILSLIICFPLSLKAKATSAKACIVICGDTGQTIYGENEDFRMPMASTTKIMTGLLLCEYGDLDREIVTTKEMVTVEGSSMGLLEGDRVSLKTLLYGLLLASGNDAANTIAIIVGGSVRNFVAMMNDRAIDMGLSDTHFETPSGLDGDTHFTTCRDLATLAMEAMKNETFRQVVATESISVSYGNPPYNRRITNHNRLLKTYDDVVGVKTGFTKKSGRCLVSAAKKDGKYVIAVTLNDPNDWQDHRVLLDRGLNGTELVNIKPNDEEINIPVINGIKDNISVKIEPLEICAKKDSKTECKVYIKPNIIAPIEEGELLGRAEYFVDGNKVAQKEIKADKNIPQSKIKKWDIYLNIFEFMILHI